MCEGRVEKTTVCVCVRARARVHVGKGVRASSHASLPSLHAHAPLPSLHAHDRSCPTFPWTSHGPSEPAFLCAFSHQARSGLVPSSCY